MYSCDNLTNSTTWYLNNTQTSGISADTVFINQLFNPLRYPSSLNHSLWPSKIKASTPPSSGLDTMSSISTPAPLYLHVQIPHSPYTLRVYRDPSTPIRIKTPLTTTSNSARVPGYHLFIDLSLITSSTRVGADRVIYAIPHWSSTPCLTSALRPWPNDHWSARVHSVRWPDDHCDVTSEWTDGEESIRSLTKWFCGSFQEGVLISSQRTSLVFEEYFGTKRLMGGGGCGVCSARF